MATFKRGYTTGVFDLFHVGHLNVLKKSKNFCDELIVGVTTDTLCLKEKGRTPFIPYTERVIILENISIVNRVVPQKSYDKKRAWQEHKFDVMFVGDDWKGTARWNKLEIEFNELGVEIVYFPYTNSTSSSRIRELIDKKLL